MPDKARKRTSFIKTMPKDVGRIVAMTTFKDVVYIATEFGVFYLSPKKRLIRCKFEPSQ